MVDINIYTEIVWTFSEALGQNYVQAERKLGKFDSFRKRSFVWRILLIILKGFLTT